MAKKRKEASAEVKEEQKIAKPKAIGPFDIIGMMFTDNDRFQTLSKSILDKNFFMINRVFAIQYPLQAQYFNRLTISKHDVIKAWQTFAVAQNGYGRVPSFVYTKGSKKTQEDVNTEIDKETKEAYCKYYNMSFIDFDDCMYFNHDAMLEHVKKFDSIFNANPNDFVEETKIKSKKTKK